MKGRGDRSPRKPRGRRTPACDDRRRGNAVSVARLRA